MRRIILLALVLLTSSLCFSETTTFRAKLHRHKSAKNQVLVDKIGGLTFDDAGRKIAFKDDAHDRFEIPYDNVTKVLFEVTSHMRGGTAARVISTVSLPGAIVGSEIARERIHNYWFYIEYKSGNVTTPMLLEVPSDASKAIIAKANGIFGTKVTMADYPDKGVQIDPDKLPDIKVQTRGKN